MIAARVVLTLAELEAYDRLAPAGEGTERRFCCPLPACRDKAVDASHRSISVQTTTGQWLCHRCGEKGVLQENWEQRPKLTARRAQVRRAFGLDRGAVAAASPSSDDFRRRVEATTPISATAGADYLERRGIDASLAEAADVVFSRDWYGRSAVVFPIRNRGGELVAANGRYLHAGADPKTRTAGAVRQGVFATPGAFDAAVLVVTEAPIDALSLAVLGFSAIALCGTSAPEWLATTAAFRPIALAFDADDAGDAAAAKLQPILQSLGAKVERWRPAGAKDWNEQLLADRAAASYVDAVARLAEVGDPRDDLTDDSATWLRFLKLACHRGVDEVGVFWSLWGMRCAGLRLLCQSDRWVLRPLIGEQGWETNDDYQRDRDRYLKPHSDAIHELLRALQEADTVPSRINPEGVDS